MRVTLEITVGIILVGLVVWVWQRPMIKSSKRLAVHEGVSPFHVCLNAASSQLEVDRERMGLTKANVVYGKAQEVCRGKYQE